MKNFNIEKEHIIINKKMKKGDRVRVSPFITKDPHGQKGKEGTVMEIVKNGNLKIVKIRFNEHTYGLYDADWVKKIEESYEEEDRERQML